MNIYDKIASVVLCEFALIVIIIMNRYTEKRNKELFVKNEFLRNVTDLINILVKGKLRRDTIFHS